MGSKTVTTLWMVIGALFLLTVVTSKPISLNTAADESDSVEVNSSEESAVQEVEEAEEVEEPEIPDATEALITVEPTATPATISLPAAVGTTALPSDTLDPQTSTDGMQMFPEEPSQTPLGVDVSQGVPESDPALSDPSVPDQLSTNTAMEAATDLTPQADHVQQEVLPTLSPQNAKVASRMAVVKPVPIYVRPGVPICFRFQYPQYVAPHYNPPRGDSN